MGGRGGMRSWMDGKIEGGKVGRLLGLMDGRMGGYGRIEERKAAIIINGKDIIS